MKRLLLVLALLVGCDSPTEPRDPCDPILSREKGVVYPCEDVGLPPDSLPEGDL